MSLSAEINIRQENHYYFLLMNEIENLIGELGKKLSTQISVPIVVGGWAVNLLGCPRQTIDFDFMIVEDEFDMFSQAFKALGFQETIRTTMYARFESNNKSESGKLYFDCLFIDRNTYGKIAQAGKTVNVFGTNFILPDPMHIIAMKLHALKHSSNASRNKDFDDIVSLIALQKIDTSKNSDFEVLCGKFGNEEILRRIRNE